MCSHFSTFPDFQTFKKDHDNLAGPIIESLKKQELKIQLEDGPIVGSTAVKQNFLDTCSSGL